MTPDEMKDRTKSFAVRVCRLVDSLPSKLSARVIGQQLIRSATSVGANYRAACRSRSDKEFIAKLGIVEEECDESAFWLELLIATETVPEPKLRPLHQEANEITAIIVASIRTARKRLTLKKRKNTDKK
jgi:four helix bundle protein